MFRYAVPIVAALGCGRVGAAPNDKPAEIPLPAPSTSGAMSLEQALAGRRSLRTLGAAPTLAEQAQLMWSAQGITDKATGHRAAPSAGALYPLELYVARADGVFHYLPGKHAFERTSDADRRAAIAKAALEQDFVRTAPAIVVVVGIPARLRPKYGERAERYMLLEAGHASQNLLLEAHALGLAATPVGAFDDDALRASISLTKDTTPIYVIPIGRR